jgi:hypothetical protein
VTRRLADAVDRLTRDHRTTMLTDEGTRYVTAPALLTQLATCWLDTGSSGHGGSDTAQPTIHVPAHDLLTLIGTEVDRELSACQVRPQLGRLLGQKVRSYGASILAFGAAEVAFAEDLVTGWVAAAEGILYPKARRRPLGRPCPACGASWVLGENGRVPAVTIAADLATSTDVWEAHCAACAADWVGEQIGHLLRAVAS